MTLPTLKQGDSGDDVRFLEQLLSSLFRFGLPPEKVKLVTTLVNFDAKYDSQTADIVSEFQNNYNISFPAPAPNITVDGVVGPETWRALGDAIYRYT